MNEMATNTETTPEELRYTRFGIAVFIVSTIAVIGFALLLILRG
jgi:hypothetical protein